MHAPVHRVPTLFVKILEISKIQSLNHIKQYKSQISSNPFLSTKQLWNKIHIAVIFYRFVHELKMNTPYSLWFLLWGHQIFKKLVMLVLKSCTPSVQWWKLVTAIYVLVSFVCMLKQSNKMLSTVHLLKYFCTCIKKAICNCCFLCMNYAPFEKSL